MSEKDMKDLNETENFDDDLISTEMLQDIRDGNQNHPKINKREKHVWLYVIVLNKINRNGKER